MKGSITSMIRHRRILVTALAAGLVLLTSIPGRSDSGGVPNENAKGYWTQDRMNRAIAIELVVDENTGIGRIQPAAGARGGGSTSKTSSSKTILSTTDWPQGSPIAQTAVGKVYFTVGTIPYVCSGALMKENDSSRAVVLTAAHCVWDQASGSFVTNWAFRPDHDSNANNPIWYASALVLRNEFASQTTFNTTALLNDWAFAVILPNSSDSRNPSNVLPDNAGANAYQYLSSGFAAGKTSFAYGYPQASPFNGATLKYAGATIFVDPNTKGTWGMNSSMTGGASGGPWLSHPTSQSGTEYGLTGSLSSVNSYKYNKDSTKMYGPFFNARTDATRNAALTATTNTRVS